MGLESEIYAALDSAFENATVNVNNESHLHAGHAGDDGSGESHWHVSITAKEFNEMSRVARHRAVHGALGPAIMGRLHALALDLKALE